MGDIAVGDTYEEGDCGCPNGQIYKIRSLTSGVCLSNPTVCVGGYLICSAATTITAAAITNSKAIRCGQRDLRHDTSGMTGSHFSNLANWLAYQSDDNSGYHGVCTCSNGDTPETTSVYYIHNTVSLDGCKNSCVNALSETCIEYSSGTTVFLTSFNALISDQTPFTSVMDSVTCSTPDTSKYGYKKPPTS